MSKGGTIKGQLERVDRELKEEFEIWDEMGVIIVNTYRMNQTEWHHHVALLACERLLKEKLGVTEDEWQLFMKKTMLDEARSFRKIVKQAQSQALRSAIVDGVGVIRPPIDGDKL